ncbi:MAG: PA0069 family radical SAM protein [Hyphomicrobiaceae bacterium]|nr:PA0069 family radical SAM protein [Hyphomicrobiaceae bacterium]
MDGEAEAERGVAIVGAERRRGRGAVSNRTGRFETAERIDCDDGWGGLDDLPAFERTIHVEAARQIVTTNDSPDISFDQSINPYRGCEHGCVYCYARPSHCYLGHSAGLDFETQLYVKPNAASLLRAELGRRGYVAKTIALGANTDPYQPIEREQAITRALLEVLREARHPVGIVTKSALVLRDLDILAEMARDDLVKVAVSVTTLDRKLARAMEPRAASPPKRIEAIAALSAAGVRTAVMVAPVIPGLNDHEIETILAAAAKAGASEAGYVTLRLPLEIAGLFEEWLAAERPERAARVMTLVRSLHAGRAYRADFGLRQRGSGPFAEQIAQRFRLATRRLGLGERRLRLRTDLFQPPQPERGQMRLI